MSHHVYGNKLQVLNSFFVVWSIRAICMFFVWFMGSVDLFRRGGGQLCIASCRPTFIFHINRTKVV